MLKIKKYDYCYNWKRKPINKTFKNYKQKSIVFSSRTEEEVERIIKFINNSNKKINLIMNNFYPSAKINKINNLDYSRFDVIVYNANIFSKINPKKINRIIYSSSSAVYNSIRKDYQFIDTNNKSLYSSTKIAVENLIYNFCSKNKISF